MGWPRWPSLRAADTIQLKAGEALQHARNLDTNTLSRGVPVREGALWPATGSALSDRDLILPEDGRVDMGVQGEV